MKRVMITGGRAYGIYDPKRPNERAIRAAEAARLVGVLNEFRLAHGPLVIIHGVASGADSLAGLWANDRARERGDPLPIEFPADWKNITRRGAQIKYNVRGEPYDALAGFVRNQKMIDEGCPDIVIAFPGGRGTADAVRRAVKAGIYVMEIE